MTNQSSIPPPSAWVRRFATALEPDATVLDVACGSGRHALLFTGRGHAVTALDRDISRIAAHPAIEAIEADLENGQPWPLKDRTFDAVVVTNYLFRPLFPILIDTVAPNGLLIYETFAAGNEVYGRPRNPDFLLRDGELLDAVTGRLRILAYEAGRIERPAPAVIQRIAAINDANSLPPLIPSPV